MSKFTITAYIFMHGLIAHLLNMLKCNIKQIYSFKTYNTIIYKYPHT